MACSTSSDSGYATPAAVAVSLAIAVIATAVTQRCALALKSARDELKRTQAEYVLAGGQQAAALAVMRTPHAVRLSWTLDPGLGPMQALAEAEAAKLAPDAAAKATLEVFEPSNPNELRSRLGGLTLGAHSLALSTLDAAPLWKACSRSAISPYGQALQLPVAAAGAPGQDPVSWRMAEVWRIRVSLPNGWTDDRIVRFTGDPSHPAAVVERRFSRTREKPRCDALIARLRPG